MSLTNTNLIIQRSHIGGVQRLYKIGNGYGLSLVNSPLLHSYKFAWEAAVLKGLKDDGSFDSITYDTPLTDDVEVFDSDDEANAFINKAIAWAESL
jgi:hypothetical protein